MRCVLPLNDFALQIHLPATQIFDLSVGGAYRDRTDDPLLAKQVLSQLS